MALQALSTPRALPRATAWRARRWQWPAVYGSRALDRHAQAGDDALRPIELIDEALHAEKHRHARLRLQQIERLGEEIVGAGGEAATRASRSATAVRIRRG